MHFFFDFVSPYAYLAWTQIHALAQKHGRTVEPVPVLFAALLDAHGTRGPAEIPAKRRYVIKDVARIARAFGVAIDLPPTHPFNPLLALRLASLELERERRRAVVDALYAAAWTERRDISDEAVVAAIARAAGLPDDAVARAQGAETKARLRAQSDGAIARGVFGVPTIADGDELFFGCDSLPHLERHLRGDPPVPADLVARWETLPASARRPGR